MEPDLTKIDYSFMEILDSIKDAAYFLDNSGKIIYLNKKAVRLFGEQRENLINRNISELVFDLKRTVLYEKIVAAKRLHKTKEFDYFSEKQQKWLLIKLYATKSGVFVFVIDNNERKNVELKNKAATLLLKRIIENIPLGVIVAEAPSGKIILANHHVARLFGRPLIETIYSDYYSDWLGFHQDGRPYKLEEWPIYKSLNYGDIIVGEEIFYYFKDKTKHLIRFRSNPIQDEKGRIIAAIAVGIDVTETKNYETELYRREQEFKGLADNSPDMILRFDRDLKFTYANPSAEKLVNMTKDRIIGRNNQEFGFPKSIVTRYNRKMARVLETGKIQKMIFSVTINNTERYFQCWFVPEFGRDKQVVSGLSISRDISELKRAEKKKDEFLSIVSHEIKTPLTSLRGYVQILKKEFPPDTVSYLDYLTKMDNQIERTVKLVNELLEISRIQSGRIKLNKKRFLLDKVIQEAAESVQQSANTHQIIIEPEKGVAVYADQDRICQVLINLINNAIKYSPGADRVIVKAKKADNKVEVAVMDFGVGIPVEYRSKIFNLFYRISNSDNQAQSGLGIGLFISSQIIKLHQGEINVRSRVGRGSTFYFTLPLPKSRHKQT